MSNTSDMLIRLRADVGQAERALGGVAGLVSKLGSSRGFQLGSLGGGLGITGVMAKAISTSEQFNASFADVQRTVNGVDAAGFRQLKTDLIDLSKTPGMPAAKDLAQIAAAGGQMNIPAERLMDFTRVVAEMSATTGMGVDQTSQALGKLSNVTGETDLRRLGSEITAVGNVNVGGIPQLLDVAQRLALVGHQMGLGVPEILAIGGAINDAGIEAEMGGSAVSRIFLSMQQAVASASMGIVTNTKDVRDAMQHVGDLGDDLGLAEEQRSEMFTRRGKLKKGVSKSSLHAADLRIARLKREQGDAQTDLVDLQHPGQNKLEAFAEIAGMSSEQFGAEFRFSPGNAFQDVLRGLHGMSSDRQQGLLDKAGINNIRDIETLAGLAGNPGHIAELYGAGQGQASDPTALGANFAIKASTDLAQQSAVLHEIDATLIALGDDLAPRMIDAEKSAIDMAKHLKDSSDLFGGIVDNLDKIVIGFAALQALPIVGALVKIGGASLSAGKTVASSGTAAVSGAAGGSGLAVAGAGLATLGAAVAADQIADILKARGVPDSVTDVLRNVAPPGGAAAVSGAKQLSHYGDVIINHPDDIEKQAESYKQLVIEWLGGLWARSKASEPVARPLGGNYGI
jgi:hypothetical protein